MSRAARRRSYAASAARHAAASPLAKPTVSVIVSAVRCTRNRRRRPSTNVGSNQQLRLQVNPAAISHRFDSAERNTRTGRVPHKPSKSKYIRIAVSAVGCRGKIGKLQNSAHLRWRVSSPRARSRFLFNRRRKERPT